MKTRITIIIASLLLLSACNWFKDLGEVTFSTDLTLDLPVVIPPAKSMPLVTPEAPLEFSSSADLMLEDNTDIEPYLSKIREIDLKSLEVTVSGLTTGQEIYTMSLSVEGIGTICTQTNITSTANTFTPEVSATLLDQAAAKLKNDKKITAVITGSANSVMAFTVSLTFDTEVTAGALD